MAEARNEMTEAERAKECAVTIMEGMKKKAFDYLGDWNTLLLYLDERIRAEKVEDVEEPAGNQGRE